MFQGTNHVTCAAMTSRSMKQIEFFLNLFRLLFMYQMPTHKRFRQFTIARLTCDTRAVVCAPV